MNTHWKPAPLPHHSYAHVSELVYQSIRRALFPSELHREIRKDARSFQAARKATTDKLRRERERGFGA